MGGGNRISGIISPPLSETLGGKFFYFPPIIWGNFGVSPPFWGVFAHFSGFWGKSKLFPPHYLGPWGGSEKSLPPHNGGGKDDPCSALGRAKLKPISPSLVVAAAGHSESWVYRFSSLSGKAFRAKRGNFGYTDLVP